MLRLILAAFALVPIAATAAGPGVVSSADPRASDAGAEMLRAGGSATDAAIAMMLALTVVEPQSSGIGGGGFFLRHDPQTGQVATIDGRETAPARATPDRFMGADGKPLRFVTAMVGGRSVGVPGNIRLAAIAHRKWGKLPWARLFDPAIRLAEEYRVSRSMARTIAQVAPLWKDLPATRALFLNGDRPKAEGETVRNPALAALLRDVARAGPRAFYKGATARAIVAAANGSPGTPGDLTMRDLARYQAKERPSVCAPYRGYRVCGMGPPSSGATTILQMLGMLERFDLKATGPARAESWHLIAEAMQLAYADREKYLGDPDYVAVPVSGLLDRSYLAQRSAMIDPARARGDYPAGMPPGAPPRTAAVSGEVAGTTHFVATDAAGSVVSMTSTVDSIFGSQTLARGMILNNELTDFTFAPVKDGAPVANAVAGGKRPLSSMSPTIVYDRDGRVVLAVGSAGGKRIIMHVMKTLVGVIDWGLSAEQAIALPNIYFGGQAVIVEKDTPLAAMVPALSAYGRTVLTTDLGSKLNAVDRGPDGRWRGAADPRSEGAARTQ